MWSLVGIPGLILGCSSAGQCVGCQWKDFIWTERFLSVGETRVQALGRPSFLGAECYPFTLYWSKRAKKASQTSWEFRMARFDQYLAPLRNSRTEFDHGPFLLAV